MPVSSSEKTKIDIERDIKQIRYYIEKQLLNPNYKINNPQIINKSLLYLLEPINRMLQYMQEIYQTIIQLADGELSVHISKDNIYAGPLKDLQSSLKHLIWQIGRVADGDYRIKVDFMGDVTVSFEQLIQQLQERESILKENLRLNEGLIELQKTSFEYELDQKEEQYNQYVKSIQEMRSYRHDMKNHLLCIHSLIQEKDIEGAEKYVLSLADIFSTLTQSEGSYNSILDALLNDKLGKAKKMNIKITKKVEIKRKLQIDNKDWCILIGNALDNCIEALESVIIEKRELCIKMVNTGDLLSVDISNSFYGNIKIINNHIITTKKDKYNHGMGIKNIEKIVRKYQGVLEIKYEKNTFHLIFLLCNV